MVDLEARNERFETQRKPKWEERTYTRAVIVRAADKGLRAYVTWEECTQNGRSGGMGPVGRATEDRIYTERMLIQVYGFVKADMKKDREQGSETGEQRRGWEKTSARRTKGWLGVGSSALAVGDKSAGIGNAKNGE